MRGPWESRVRRLLREPTVWFFVVGAVLFVANRFVAGNPRVIEVTPGVKAGLERQFRDTNGRPPTPDELSAALRKWEWDEVLYREAIRERLDRDDPTIRAVLADHERARLALGVVDREPTDDELDRWLAAHRELYEVPRRYDYQVVSFAKRDPAASIARSRYLEALARGADPRTLGRPILGGNLTADELGSRLGPSLAARIIALPQGRWEPLEDENNLLAARVNATGGGLPPPEVLRARLIADWSYATRQSAIEQAVQRLAARYRFVGGP